MSHPLRALAGAVLAAVSTAALVTPALAEQSTTTSSSSTSTSSTTSTTVERSTTTTTPPKPRPSTTTTAPPPSTVAPPPETTTTTSTTLAPGQVPPEVQALIDAYPRTPAGSTTELVAILDAVPEDKRPRGFGRFPVAGLARWSHDWLFPRHTPSFHTHEGTDVFASRGTPVISPAAGKATVSNGSIGGLAVRITQPDGTYWYLSHLDTLTVADGADLIPGDVVGTVGDSGNAKGGAPHVHVEVHPYGGPAHDPKPLLDAYYTEALAAAPDVLRYLGVWVRPVRLHPLPDDVVAALVDVTPDSPETAAG